MITLFIKYFLIFYNAIISKILFLFILSIIALGLGLFILKLLKIRFVTKISRGGVTPPFYMSEGTSPLLEIFLFASGIGFGLISIITLILGMYFSLNKSAFLILAVLAVILSIKSLYSFLKLAFSSLNNEISLKRYHIFLFIIILLCLFSNIYSSLFPPTEWDELMYHLMAPKRYIEENHISYTPEIIYSYMPLNMEMLYTLAMLFDSDISARLIHNWMTILTMLSLFTFSRRFFCKNTAYFSAFIFYTMPIIGYLSPIAYIDFGLTFYVFLSVYAFVIWFKNEKDRWLILSGLLLGFALGTKHIALIVLMLLVLAIIQKTITHKKQLGFFLLAECTLIFSALIVVYLWYYRAYLYTGNPFIPFMTNIFGGGEYITPQDVLTLKESLKSYNGIGQSPIHFFLLPITLTIFPKEFHGNMGIFLLLFSFPLLFLKNVSKIIKSFIFYSMLFTLIWFITSQQMRFLLPVLMLFSIISAYTLVRINGWVDLTSKGEYTPRPLRSRDATHCVSTKGILNEEENCDIRFGLRKIKEWIRLISILILLIGTFLHLIAYDSFFNLLRKVPYDNSQRAEFYNNNMDSYSVIQFANNHLPENTIIYTYGDASKKYLYENKVIGDLFGYGAYFKLDLNKTVGNAYMRSFLKQFQDLNVTHIIINFNRPEHKVNWDFWNQHLKLLYSKNNISLYEINY